MHNRWPAIATGGACMLAVLTGCSEQRQEPAPPPPATLTLGGEQQRLPSLHCSRFTWWAIDMSDDDRSVSAVVDQWEGDATARFVKIRNIDGFTGSYWEGGVGNATTSYDGTTFTITGDVYGISDQKPNAATTLPFELVAPC